MIKNLFHKDKNDFSNMTADDFRMIKEKAVDTGFKKAVQEYRFEEALNISETMENDDIIMELINLAKGFYPCENLMPLMFTYQNVLFKNDYKWNYILMRLLDISYFEYDGMIDIQLKSVRKVLELDSNNKGALQTITHLYEHEDCDCTEEEYEKAKAKMEELGITMYD